MKSEILNFILFKPSYQAARKSHHVYDYSANKFDNKYFETATANLIKNLQSLKQFLKILFKFEILSIRSNTTPVWFQFTTHLKQCTKGLAIKAQRAIRNLRGKNV